MKDSRRNLLKQLLAGTTTPQQVLQQLTADESLVVIRFSHDEYQVVTRGKVERLCEAEYLKRYQDRDICLISFK